MKYNIYIVTGAPGSGKSTTVEAFIQLKTNFLAFDIDWLIDSASELADRDIHVDESTWKPYGALWFNVLHATLRNHKTPVLFAPWDENDLKTNGIPDWCQSVEWLLLDCEDVIRCERLAHRHGWSEQRIEDAILDAASLRQTITKCIDTGKTAPEEIAGLIYRWITDSEAGTNTM